MNKISPIKVYFKLLDKAGLRQAQNNIYKKQNHIYV